MKQADEPITVQCIYEEKGPELVELLQQAFELFLKEQLKGC